MLLPILAEHLEDQEGEVLPHLLIADLKRWAERVVADVPELMAVSFVEHLPRRGEPAAQLRDLLGPHLAQQLADFGF